MADLGLLPSGLEPICVPPPLSLVDPDLSLPEDMLIAAAEESVKIHPANAPPAGAFAMVARAFEAIGEEPPPEKRFIAAQTQFYWGAKQRTLTVGFPFDDVPTALAQKIVDAGNSWQCGVTFKLVTKGIANLRISLGPGGYWSYVGNSILQIPTNQPTMNLEAWSLQARASEWLRVPPHEFGHSLGFIHEHARPAVVDLLDREAVYDWARRTQGWGRRETDAQILTAIDEASLMGTPADVESVMAYMFGAALTKNGVAIPGGSKITARDRAFAAKIYPPDSPPPPPPPGGVLAIRTPPSTAEKPVAIGGKLYLVTSTTTTTLTPVA